MSVQEEWSKYMSMGVSVLWFINLKLQNIAVSYFQTDIYCKNKSFFLIWEGKDQTASFYGFDENSLAVFTLPFV